MRVRYSEKQINEINKLIKDSDLNQSQIAEAVNKKFPNAADKVKPDTVTHYARKYFKVPKDGALNKAYKKRFAGVLTTKEGTEKLLKLLKNKKDLKAAITKDFNDGMILEDIRLKYRPGGAGANLMPVQVPKMGKDLLKRLLGEYNLDFEARKLDLRKVDVTSDDAKDLAKRIRTLYADKTLSREAANKKLGLSLSEVKVFEKRWNEKNPNDPLIKTKRINEPFKGAGQQTQKYKNKTKQLQKFQTFLKKYQNNPPKTGTTALAKVIKASGLSPVGFQQDIERLKRIYKGESRPGFVIDKTLKSNIGKFPISTALTRDVLLQAGYTTNQIKKIDKAQNIIRFLERDKGAFLNQLEHKIPKSIVTLLKDNKKIDAKQYKQLIGQITPVTSSLNQWKKYFDLQRLTNLEEFLVSPMEKADVLKFNKAENEIIKTTKNISGGYDIGKIKVDVDGNIDIKSPDEVFTTKTQGIGPQSRAIIDYYKNLKYHNNIAKAYNADKTNPIFGTLNAYTRGSDVKLFDETITNDLIKADTPEKLIKYLTQSTQSPLFKGLLKTANPALKSKIVRGLRIGGAGLLGVLVPTMLIAAGRSPKRNEIQQPEVKQPEVGTPIKYDSNVGAIVNENTDQPASQNQILSYIKDNPLKVTAGTSLGFAAPEVPGAYKAARELGRGKVRSALGITGALKPLLTTIGTPAMTGLLEVPIAAKRLEEGESATEILTDPLGPALGVAFMEPFSRGAGVIQGAPKRTMAQGLRNYFNLSNVGQARPGLTSSVLRLGMSPRMIAGATRFLGIPGLLLGAGLSGYDAYKNYQNQEGFLYNLLNRDE